LIGVEPEIIKRAPANRVRVLILHKGFAVPCQRVGSLGRSPRGAAKSLAVKRAIVCPSRMLRRRVKFDVADVNPRSQRHAERLNGAVEVFVKQRVLIVPDSRRRIGHLVTHEPNTVVSRIRLDPVDCCSSPRPDGRLHPCSVTVRAKVEIGGASHIVLSVGGVVIHVALPGVSLAPGILVRRYILRFGKIARALIECCIQIIDLHQNPVRYAVVAVATVIIGARWKVTGEWIDPGTRTDSVLTAI